MLRFFFLPYCEKWAEYVSAAGGQPIARFAGVDLATERVLGGMLIHSTHMDDGGIIRVLVLSANTDSHLPSDTEVSDAAEKVLSTGFLLLNEMDVPFEGLPNSRAFIFEDDDTRFLDENRDRLEESSIRVVH